MWPRDEPSAEREHQKRSDLGGIERTGVDGLIVEMHRKGFLKGSVGSPRAYGLFPEQGGYYAPSLPGVRNVIRA